MGVIDMPFILERFDFASEIPAVSLPLFDLTDLGEGVEGVSSFLDRFDIVSDTTKAAIVLDMD